jgi:putative MATE family efflux protein
MKPKETLGDNIMGTMSEGKLLLTISLPMMFSMLIQALYNVVDSYFVGRISENALTALQLAFPIQNLMIGVAVGTGVGINSLLSRRLGQKDQKAVDAVAMNGIFLALLSTLVFMIFGLFFTRTYFVSQTDVPEIIEAGTTYLQICSVICFGIFFDITFARLLQSTGRTVYSMYGQLFGALTNIVLDPILIFGWFGFPKLGVAGAAYATVIGQVFSMGLDLAFNLIVNKEIRFRFRGFRPNGRIIKEIYAVGVPAILNTSIFSIMTFGMNRILIGFSTAATAVLGVYFKLQSFIYMPLFGLNNGVIPIVAYNYGAEKPERIKRTLKLALLCAGGIMLFGLLVFQLFPYPILRLFLESPETLDIGVSAFRTISLGFVFSGVVFVLSSVFQALGRGTLSLIVQLTRQLVAVLPLAYLFSLSGTVNAVWWAFPAAELLAVAVTLTLYRTVSIKQLAALAPDARQTEMLDTGD